MSYSSRVGKYLEIITSRVTFISKEMNRFVLSARDVLLGLDMTQAIGFIPACWKNIEGNFTADGESNWEEWVVRQCISMQMDGHIEFIMVSGTYVRP